jgi:hypothetical protein
MSRQTCWLVTVLLVAGSLWLPAGTPVFARSASDPFAGVQAAVPSMATGAGAGTFGSGASFGGVPLSTMRYGMGVDLLPDGTAIGDFQSTLLGGTVSLPRTILVEGKATAQSVSNGVATISGLCRIDMGDGTAPLPGVPFTVVVAPGSNQQGTLTLTLGATHLPVATLTSGSTTLK